MQPPSPPPARNCHHEFARARYRVVTRASDASPKPRRNSKPKSSDGATTTRVKRRSPRRSPRPRRWRTFSLRSTRRLKAARSWKTSSKMIPTAKRTGRKPRIYGNASKIRSGFRFRVRFRFRFMGTLSRSGGPATETAHQHARTHAQIHTSTHLHAHIHISHVHMRALIHAYT